MIRSFNCRETQAVFEGRHSRKFHQIVEVAERKLVQLHAAVRLADVARFPGNRLEPLRGNRVGQHSIRINDKYRICFVWRGEDAHHVEIVDYH